MRNLIMLALGIMLGVGGWLTYQYATSSGTSPAGRPPLAPAHRLAMLGNPGITFRALWVSADGQCVWLGGSGGTIRYSTDGGHTWQAGKVPPLSKDIYDIRFLPDNRRGWAVGAAGLALQSADSGATWQAVPQIKEHYDIRGIAFSPNGTDGVLTVDFSGLWMTHDGGVSWQQQLFKSSSGLVNYYGAAFQQNNQCVIWGTGTLCTLRSLDDNPLIVDVDYGSQLIRSGIGYPSRADYPDFNSLYAIRAAQVSPTSRRTVAADTYGRILIKAEGNATWHYRPLPGRHAPAGDLWFDARMQQGWVVTGSPAPAIFRTPDGGENWTRQYADSAQRGSGSLFRVRFAADARHGWACGAFGIVQHTENGSNWQPVNPFDEATSPDYSGLRTDFTDLVCLPGDTVVAVGSPGTIVQSGDKGRHWQPRWGNAAQPALHAITAMPGSSRHLWAVGDTSVVLESHDGGTSWQPNQDAFRAARQTGITDLYYLGFFPDGRHGIAIGQCRETDTTGEWKLREVILLTADSGRHWQSKPVVFPNSLRCLAIENNRVLLFSQSGYLSSTDYGKNWTYADFSSESIEIDREASVAFTPDLSRGYLVNQGVFGGYLPKRGSLYYSATQGHSWQPVTGIPNVPVTYSLDLSSVALRGSQVVVARNSEQGLQSGDGGRTWFRMFQPSSGAAVRKILFSPAGELFGVGDQGLLMGPGRPDERPVIKRFTIEQGSKELTASLAVPDADTPDAQKRLAVTVSGKFNAYVDTLLLTRQVRGDSLDRLRWPASAFIEGQTYTFVLTVSDGTSVVSSTVRYPHGQTVGQRLLALYFLSPGPKDGGEWAKASGIWLATLGGLYALLVLLLYALAPWHYVRWHEAVAASQLPLPESLPKFLALFLITTPRSLDAFVRHYRPAALAAFDRNPDTKTRPEWVPAPWELNGQAQTTFTNPDPDGRSPYTPGLTEIRQQLGPESAYDILLVEGPGGVGKTSLALQLARWAGKDHPGGRLYGHLALPLVLQSTAPGLDQAAVDELRRVVDRPQLSQTLAWALLRAKRILVVADGLTEMPDFSASQLNPNNAASYSKAVVYTTRRPLPSLYHQTIVKIIPLGINLASLDTLLDKMISVLAGAGRFENEREILRGKIVRVMQSLQRGDTKAPFSLTFVQLMIAQAIALWEAGRPLTDLPEKLGDLLDKYLATLFWSEANVVAAEEAIRALRVAALVSLQATSLLEPLPDPVPDPLAASLPGRLFQPQRHPVEAFTSQPVITPALLQLLLDSGALVAEGGAGTRTMKFSQDPVAEFCVARELVQRCRLGKLSVAVYDQLVLIADQQNPNVALFMRELRSELPAA